MAIPSRGKFAKANKVVKPKNNNRRTTISTRNHRFQSFSERISTLKIDPIRRKRYVDKEEEAVEDTKSFFGQSLQEWRDTNTTETFVAFAKEVSPLCDNLVMVLHNQQSIMDILVRYIERADALALEPLLSLLAHFAHDLDIRFEKHFERAVATVTTVAGTHQDFDVIEWSFTCLTWLFKYLSRLLAPDLRPLYRLLAPYLGKKTQKPFVIRFTAEALSFLLRKTASTWERDQIPLDIIVAEMLRDCSDSPDADLFHQGIMTLLTEAMKGVQNGFHLCGLPLLRTVLKHAGQMATHTYTVVDAIVNGVLTSLIHHCTPETFQPVTEIVMANARIASSGSHMSNIRFYATTLFTAMSVRKGSRISNWASVMLVVQELLSAYDRAQTNEKAIQSALLASVAGLIQTATLDAVLAGRDLPRMIRQSHMSPRFLEFCDLVSRTGRERFDSFVLPQLQAYLLECKELDLQSAHLEKILALIPRFAATGHRFVADQGIVKGYLDDLEAILKHSSHITDNYLARWNATLAALTSLKLEGEQVNILKQLLMNVVRLGMDTNGDAGSQIRNLALGPAFARLLDISHDISGLAQLWPSLCRVSPNFVESPGFWSNVHRLVDSAVLGDLDQTDLSVLESSITDCLSMPSHSIRHDALQILAQTYHSKQLAIPNQLQTMIDIESMEVTLATSGWISMNIRQKLAMDYAKLKDDDILIRAIPSYCFGLLYVKLSQAWTDAIGVLAAICQSKTGEEIVISLAQKWINMKPPVELVSEVKVVLNIESDGFKVLSDFECPNLAKMSAICTQIFEEPLGGLPTAAERYASDLKRTSIVTPNSRTQALSVLSKIPNIAEKRSRLLVPVLLRWAGEDSLGTPDEEVSTCRWSRKDQKAMLAIFAQFVNPKVLYKSAEVYDALLALCANGDVEIQRSALKAILAWKNAGLTRHAEHLTNLLDDAQFKGELTVFLQTGDTEDAIPAQDLEHLMPVLLRLLYGKAVAGNKEGQSGRRKDIFRRLSQFGEVTLGLFLDIATNSLKSTDRVSQSGSDELSSQVAEIPLRQQLGLLNMLNDMLQTLGAELEPFVAKITDAILACTINASYRLEQESTTGTLRDSSLLRSIRQTGMQCLVGIYANMEVLDVSKHGRVILEALVVPRLPKFAEENSQSISGLLRLLGAWSQHDTTAQLFASEGAQILQKVAELLQSEHATDEVQLFIQQHILSNLVSETSDETVLQPAVTPFVQSIGVIIQRQPSKEVLDACVKSFSLLSTRITNTVEAADVVKTCTDLLKQPDKMVSQFTKAGLLRTLLPLVSRFTLVEKQDLYNALCALFSRLRDAENRLLLSKVYRDLVCNDDELSETAVACMDMNARGHGLADVDHDRRESAFKFVYGSAERLTLKQWLPFVHNCLYFIRDPEDRVNRSSASHSLRLFVDAVAKMPTDSSWLSLVDNAIFPSIEIGMRARSELVRAEYLLVLGHIVEKLPTWQKVKPMQALVVGGDDEASFFTNVLHIQHHRRLRALRRLSDECSQLNSYSVAKVFLPLLEHFVFDQAEGDAGRTLSDQAVQTIGTIAKNSNWSSFRSTFQRYTSHLKPKTDLEKPGLEKTVLRLLGAMVDGLSSEVGKAHSENIIREFLPPLLDFLHLKDESTVDRRMPVAVTIVKLLLHLPEVEFAARLPPVLTDVSHVLRSRSQEARDQTRKALATMSSLVGAQYFRFVLKELRSALKRGYQLHVLSFTVHSLLVSNSFDAGDLDECLPDLMVVIMDDIFGVTGQEKDAEEYKTSMKEIKSSKSFDTLELLAKITPVQKLGELVRPIRALLAEKIDLKVVQKIDNLLARLRKGLDQNPASEQRSMLSFCWEVANQDFVEDVARPAAETQVDERRKRYIVQPEAKVVKSKSITTSFRFKLVTFGLDLLRKVLRRHDDLQTPQNLTGFLPIAGDAIVQNQQEEVKLAAVRLLSTIMKVPMPQIEDNAAVYVKEAVAMIKGAANSTTDGFKVALELITSVLRERRSIDIRERDLALVLKRIKADIDEPDRQGIIYRFLRAVIGRKIVVTEVYEVMDEVGHVMIKNEDRNVRESARGAYFHFIMEFPQGKDRWKKQIEFLKANLQYKYPGGRQGVMELMHQMLSRLADEAFDDVAEKLFVALVFVMVNDQDSSCRDMANLLIGKIFECSSEAALRRLMESLGVWLQTSKRAEVKMGALKCWASLLETERTLQKQTEVLQSKLREILQEDPEPRLAIVTLQTFTTLVRTTPEVGLSQKSAGMWLAVQQLSDSKNGTLHESTANLLGALFTDFASHSAKTGKALASLPLLGSGGLELAEEDLCRLCAVHLRSMKSIQDDWSEPLVAQTNRNIVFLGRCFSASQMQWRGLVTQAEEEEEQAEESSSEVEASAETNSASANRLASEYLLTRLARIIQTQTHTSSSRLAAMSAIDALLPHISASVLPLPALLRPLNALVDPNIPRSQSESLEQKAQETLDAIQKCVGNETFLAALSAAQRDARARREGRRQKRRIEAISAPEKWAREKRRRYEVKKARVKVKGEEARGRRRGW